jgi:hypothetical protein
LSAAGRPARPFLSECCFPGIYFVANIFFLWMHQTPGTGVMETSWLKHAVKNAWANGGNPAFC